jgi:RimJ/RimL family protein N-acetyltransferase
MERTLASTVRTRLSGAVEVPTAAPPTTLRTRRMLLRPLIAADRPAYLAAVAVSRPALDRCLPLHIDSQETDRAMFDRQLELARIGSTGARDWLRFVGVLDDGTIAGGFNLSAISRGLEWRADVNWWVASTLTGRGLATEGVRALAEHALADLPAGLGLTELQAWITRDNAPSAAIARRLGFTRSGEERTYLLTDSQSWVLHDLWVQRAR